MRTRIPQLVISALLTVSFSSIVYSKTMNQKTVVAVTSKSPSMPTSKSPLTSASASASAKSKNSNLTTDAKFGDQAVGGKYQLPMEALSVVENEKSIDDLIGVRKNFKDRVQRSKGMR